MLSKFIQKYVAIQAFKVNIRRVLHCPIYFQFVVYMSQVYKNAAMLMSGKYIALVVYSLFVAACYFKLPGQAKAINSAWSIWLFCKLLITIEYTSVFGVYTFIVLSARSCISVFIKDKQDYALGTTQPLRFFLFKFNA